MMDQSVLGGWGGGDTGTRKLVLIMMHTVRQMFGRVTAKQT